jgi:hypothetical protein
MVDSVRYDAVNKSKLRCIEIKMIREVARSSRRNHLRMMNPEYWIKGRHGNISHVAIAANRQMNCIMQVFHAIAVPNYHIREHRIVFLRAQHLVRQRINTILLELAYFTPSIQSRLNDYRD